MGDTRRRSRGKRGDTSHPKTWREFFAGLAPGQWCRFLPLAGWALFWFVILVAVLFFAALL